MLDTQTTENYLSKYICRTAVTPKRIHYDSATNMVELLHKNYNDQKTGEPAPLNITNLFPLDAIQMILQHKLPFGFHKSRYYGIHSTSTTKKIKPLIPATYLRDKRTIKQLFSILKLVERLLGLPDSSIYRCKACGSENIDEIIVTANRMWAGRNIKGLKIPRSPPSTTRHTIKYKTIK